MNRFLPLFALFAVLFVLRAEPAQGAFGTTVTTYQFAPSKVLADPTRDRVYALVPADNTLRVINTLNTLVDTIQLPVDSIPVDMTLSRDHSLLYIANSGTTIHAVSVVGNLDSATPAYLRSIPLDGPGLGIASTVDSTTGDDLLFVLTTETLIIPPDPKTPLNPPTTQVITPVLVVDGTKGKTLSQVGEDNVTHNFVGTSLDGTLVVVAGSLGLETFSVASGMRTAANPTIGATAVQLIISNTGLYFCVPDPAGNGNGTPLTTLLFDEVNPPGYYGTFSDPATPGPLAFAPDDSFVYQLRFSDTNGPELLVFSTNTFLQTVSAVLPTNGLTLSAKGRNTVALDRSGGLLFIGASTNFQSNSPGQLVVVEANVTTPPVINSTLSVSGMVGTPFTYQISGTSSPTSFDATGLPPGLTVDPLTGLISGTPTRSGVYEAIISASNNTGTGTATLVFTIVEAGMNLIPVISNDSLPDGTTRQDYTATITATNAPDSFAASGLPTGLSIDPTTGVISGAPTVSGFFAVNLSATNEYGTGETTLGLVINAALPAPPVITSNGTATTAAGAPFAYRITATNSPTSFAAANLPKGLNVDPSTGLIAGTPTAVGTFPVGLSATNAGGTGTAALTLTVTPAPVPGITSPTSDNALTSVAYSYQITATNNPTSFAASNLPSGLSINSITGLISGTPTTAGVFNVALNATNATGTGSAVLLLTITATPPAITSSTTATASLGQPYSYLITANNSPTSFAAVDLPPGLNVDTATGLISGTPNAPGVYTVVISATNSGGTIQTNLTLTVVAVLPTVDIMASVSHVTAGSGDQAAIVVSRTGDSSAKLVVHYTIKGSARNGTDYETITGSVKIKRGQVSATILITPKGSQSGGTVKTVALTLQPSAVYQVGSASKAKVKILPGS